MGDGALSRREVLVGAGAAGLGAITIGTGTAGAESPERHIVGVETAAAEAAAKRRADSVYRVIELGSYPTAVAGVFSAKARDQLAKRNDVAYVEPDVEHEIVGEVLPWGIDRMDADVAHGKGETGGDGGGAHIAIIDTGIDDDHPDLHGNLATPLDETKNHKAWENCKGSNCNYAWSDDHDHGTHVSGTVDAIDNTEGVIGVSTEATLHAAKVCSKAGFCSSSDIAAALEWTADNEYDVANLSLGGSYSETIDNAGKYAYDKGVLLVAAAGNDGPCTDCVSYPAANEEFIAVSATTCDDSLANFSSTGSEVELAAPGDDVYSTVIGGYSTFSGTSMATPHVAGAGGQLVDNGYSNTEARDQLNATAEDIDLSSKEQGNGLVDVAAALGFDSSDDGLGDGPNCGDSDDGGGDGGGNAPAVESLSLSEDNSNGSPHADFDASWSVSDSDGDLDTVDLTLTDTDTGETEDSASVDVSGSDASGSTDLKAKFDDGNGHTYEVELVVTDSNGNTASDTATEVEDGS